MWVGGERSGVAGRHAQQAEVDRHRAGRPAVGRSDRCQVEGSGRAERLAAAELEARPRGEDAQRQAQATAAAAADAGAVGMELPGRTGNCEDGAPEAFVAPSSRQINRGRP